MSKRSSKKKSNAKVSSEKQLLVLFRKQHRAGSERGQFQPLDTWLGDLAKVAKGVTSLGGTVRVGDHGTHPARAVIKALQAFRDEQPKYLRGVALSPDSRNAAPKVKLSVTESTEISAGIRDRQRKMVLASLTSTVDEDEMFSKVMVADVLSWTIEFPDLELGDALLKSIDELGEQWRIPAVQAVVVLDDVHHETGQYDREEAFKRVLASF